MAKTFKATPSQLKMFFVRLNQARLSLGLTGPKADDYYREVLRECARCGSVKTIPSKSAFDACLERFALDTGDFSTALKIEIDKAKRYAYVIKVIVLQILQLSRIDLASAREYFDGVLFRSRTGYGRWISEGETWYLDLPERDLLLFVQILDTHLRRLKRRLLPPAPLRFNDRVRFVPTLCVPHGVKFSTVPVDPRYYDTQPFAVRAKA